MAVNTDLFYLFNSCYVYFAEHGLKQAERVTNALYKGNVDGLAELNYAEIKQTFQGAAVVDILTEPGMSILQLAMKAKCFPTESKLRPNITHACI